MNGNVKQQGSDLDALIRRAHSDLSYKAQFRYLMQRTTRQTNGKIYQLNNGNQQHESYKKTGQG
jgi:hypothetical protein